MAGERRRTSETNEQAAKGSTGKESGKGGGQRIHGALGREAGVEKRSGKSGMGGDRCHGRRQGRKEAGRQNFKIGKKMNSAERI
ncbi:hypothetical protein Nepgr_015857 [Nepenthes gracilis]|uniref:Uncharacterized protein n=1 Tax=Nepenthes gracilis TaxID=150966 RepID=A0AAD3SPA1_NEPGR|nr:hypothetical protein Nepgr_015857 [Nepenthes gracilis]